MRAKFLIILLFVLLFSVFAVMVLRDPGYVLLSYGNKVIETSLWIFLIAGGILFFTTVFVWEVLRQITSSRFGIQHWVVARGAKKALGKTNNGLIQLAEGNWQKAELLLSQAASKARNPLINYLGAAKAANAMGETPKRDEYLRLANELTDGADIAVGLTQAQLQHESKQWESCLATLLQLQKNAPKHNAVLKLLSVVYHELGDWNQLRDLLPQLKKQKVLSKVDYLDLERQVYREALTRTLKSNHTQALKVTHLMDDWAALPAVMKKDLSLIEVYCRLLIDLKEYDKAATTIQNALNRGEWSDALANLYGRVKSADPSQQLAVAEAWLRQRTNNSELMLALGRISLQNKLWGKALEYFESSLKLCRSAEAYGELGRMYARQGEHEKSNEYFQKSLEMLSQTLPDLPLPDKSLKKNAPNPAILEVLEPA